LAVIAIRGAESKIAQELLHRIPHDERRIVVLRGADMPLDADRYFFCQGLLRPKRIEEQSLDELTEGYAANAGQVISQCERILEHNESARVCVIGSETAYYGSYDGNYARAKRDLHTYIETRTLDRPEQQLVGISPNIIEDCGMTLRRADVGNVSQRRMAHPKGRFVFAAEIASLVHYLLYVDMGYLSGVMIRMNGGAAR
jgi:NAD(P)-dependent dehydrogenase (short-subunit alcohol dehydrogenase family)